MRILGLELRRVLKTKITIIILAATLVLTVVMVYLPVTFVSSSYVNTEGKVVEITGREAIAYKKKIQKEVTGEITGEDVQKAVQQYQECLSAYGAAETYELPEGVYETEILPYAPLLHGIREAFADPETGIAPSIMNIPVEKVADFYDICEERIEALMKMEQRKHPEAQQDAIEMYAQVKKPYEFYPGYNTDAMDYQLLLSFVIMVISVVIAAPVFSSDYQTGADDILRCTKYGKVKLAVVKIISELLISGIIYTVYMSLYLIVSNTLFGWECTETSVQMLYSVINLVNMNIGELQIYVAVTGLITVLATVTLALFLSSRFKNVVVSLGTALMICILPVVFYIALPADIAPWFYVILPSSGVGILTSILYSLLDFVYLSVGTVSVWLPYAMIGVVVVEIPLFIFGAVRNYTGYSERYGN